MVASISWETCGSDPALRRVEATSVGKLRFHAASLRSADPCCIQTGIAPGPDQQLRSRPAKSLGRSTHPRQTIPLTSAATATRKAAAAHSRPTFCPPSPSKNAFMMGTGLSRGGLFRLLLCVTLWMTSFTFWWCSSQQYRFPAPRSSRRPCWSARRIGLLVPQAACGAARADLWVGGGGLRARRSRRHGEVACRHAGQLFPVQLVSVASGHLRRRMCRQSMVVR